MKRLLSAKYAKKREGKPKTPFRLLRNFFAPLRALRGQTVLLFLVSLTLPVQARDELHLYNWNNYISDATVARFEASCRCKLVQDYYSDNEEMLAKLAAGATGDRRSNGPS